MNRRATIAFKVPFHDVDAMGIVWHGNYVKYFEVARCAVLDAIGYGYDVMKASGVAWPVVDMRLRYVKPMVFDQDVEVTATILEWESRLRVDYLATDRATGAKLTTGSSIQVAVNMSTGEMLFASPSLLLACMSEGEP